MKLLIISSVVIILIAVSFGCQYDSVDMVMRWNANQAWKRKNMCWNPAEIAEMQNVERCAEVNSWWFSYYPLMVAVFIARENWRSIVSLYERIILSVVNICPLGSFCRYQVSLIISTFTSVVAWVTPVIVILFVFTFLHKKYYEPASTDMLWPVVGTKEIQRLSHKLGYGTVNRKTTDLDEP